MREMLEKIPIVGKFFKKYRMPYRRAFVEKTTYSDIYCLDGKRIVLFNGNEYEIYPDFGEDFLDMLSKKYRTPHFDFTGIEKPYQFTTINPALVKIRKWVFR